MTPPQPLFSGNGPYDGFYFVSAWKWYDGVYDPSVLLAALLALPSLAPFADDLGNMQQAVVLFLDPDAAAGIWVVVPAGTAWGPIDSVASGIEGASAPVVPPSAQEDLAAVLIDPGLTDDEKWTALAVYFDPDVIS